MSTRVRVAYGEFIGPPKLVLGGGGPGASDADLVRTMSELADVARRLAPTVACAFVRVRPTFLSVSYLTDRLPPPRRAGFVDALGDELLHDGAPFHILGPRHVRRLTEAGTLSGAPSRAVLPSLPGDRYELTIGSWTDWLPDSASGESIMRVALQVLGPCLLSSDEATDLFRARRRAEEEALPT